MNLDGVHQVDHAVGHHAPTDDEQRCGGYGAGLHERCDAHKEDGHGQHPPQATDRREPRGGSQVEKQVERAQDEHARQNKHQAVDKRVGKQGEPCAQDDRTDAHDGERRHRTCEAVALGVVDFHTLLRGLTLCRQVGHGADDARNEEDDSDGDGNPCHRLLAILHEKGSHDNGAESSENAALEYFHVAKVIKSCYQRSFGGEFFNILNVKYD